MVQSSDMPGRFVHRGELLAYVMDYSKVAVQVVVPQGEVDLVRKMTRRVELRQVERIPDVLTARVKRVVPAATNQLPNMAARSRSIPPPPENRDAAPRPRRRPRCSSSSSRSQTPPTCWRSAAGSMSASSANRNRWACSGTGRCAGRC
jgi:hypothetical protein